MIELCKITKIFPSNKTKALDNADFSLRPGEIHALLGENGAGKSTLMHILAGLETPNNGKIIVDNKEAHFKTHSHAQKARIGMVRQHPHPVWGFKVWQDCVLGTGRTRNDAEKTDRLWGFDLPLNEITEDLSVSQRQKAAVLSLVLRNARYMIFDESSAILNPEETESLYNLFRRLKDSGHGIVIISHKLEEALKLSDRVTVINHGKTAESRLTSSLTKDELESLIFGENKKPKFHYKKTTNTQKSIISVRNLSANIPGKAPIINLNLEIKNGIITGITGDKNSGLDTLELLLTGFADAAFGGEIILGDKRINSVKSFREAGGVYLGSDRLGRNLIPPKPLEESLIIHAHRRAARGIAGKFGIMNRRYLDAFCKKIMKRAGIDRKTESIANSFSGGMLQCILLARELEENPALFVLGGGTAGLDKQNRNKFTLELKALVNNNGAYDKAVLLFSADPDELSGMADEIIVI